MKKILFIMISLLSVNSFAADICSASYAAGLGHVMKGESVSLGNLERVSAGETSMDEFYTFTVKNVSGKVQPVLKETKSGKAVALKVANAVPGVSIYSTQKLSVFPEGIPGAFSGNKFVIVICGDEANF
jgi:hypothetical protein